MNEFLWHFRRGKLLKLVSYTESEKELKVYHLEVFAVAPYWDIDVERYDVFLDEIVMSVDKKSHSFAFQVDGVVFDVSIRSSRR